AVGFQVPKFDLPVEASGEEPLPIRRQDEGGEAVFVESDLRLWAAWGFWEGILLATVQVPPAEPATEYEHPLAIGRDGEGTAIGPEMLVPLAVPPGAWGSRGRRLLLGFRCGILPRQVRWTRLFVAPEKQHRHHQPG